MTGRRVSLATFLACLAIAVAVLSIVLQVTGHP